MLLPSVGETIIAAVTAGGCDPDRKKYSLLKDKYFCKDSRICYFRSKSLNMRSEWGNIKECNKNPRAILNTICGRSGQLMMNP